MLQPTRTKFRKAHKGRIHGIATCGDGPGLRPVRAQGAGAGARHRAPDRGGAARAHPPHEARRPGLDPRLPDVPVSKKPLEVRMGSGKGAPEFWVCRVKPGRILFEIDGVPVEIAKRGADARRRQAADQDALRRAHRGLESRSTTMKAADAAGHDRRPARRRGAQAQEGAVQPALPAGDRAAREHLARARGAPRHRADQDHRAQKRAACKASAQGGKGRAAKRSRSRSKRAKAKAK